MYVFALSAFADFPLRKMGFRFSVGAYVGIDVMGVDTGGSVPEGCGLGGCSSMATVGTPDT